MLNCYSYSVEYQLISPNFVCNFEHLTSFCLLIDRKYQLFQIPLPTKTIGQLRIFFDDNVVNLVITILDILLTFYIYRDSEQTKTYENCTHSQHERKLVNMFVILKSQCSDAKTW